MAHNHALMQIAVKAILRKDDKILALTTQDGYVDFPGGRMDDSEVDLPLADVLKREVQEELGGDVSFEINHFAFAAKRQYQSGGQTHNILAVYYDISYLDGELALSDEHATLKWVLPNELFKLASKFVSRDEFEQYKKYFS